MPIPTSENRIVQLLKNRYSGKSRSLKRGIGDDAAVIRPGHAEEYWVITTDMMLEQIDFRREWTTPRRLGSKSIAVNLSDLAAMGARPRFFTVSLAIPSRISERWIMDFYQGLTASGNAGGARLIGGDLSRSKSGIIISVAAFGESLNRKILYRSGGRAGDFLYVTGVLGRSAAGLRLLQVGRTHPRSHSQKEAIQIHQTPVPRCEAGIWLAQCGLVSCMMDLSDGLSTDLPRMCAASAVGAEIHLADLPVFADSAKWDCDPVALALNGGEDYELLLAVPSSKSRLFEKQYPAKFPRITKVGRMTRDSGKIFVIGPDKRRIPLKEQGFDHFRNKHA